MYCHPPVELIFSHCIRIVPAARLSGRTPRWLLNAAESRKAFGKVGISPHFFQKFENDRRIHYRMNHRLGRSFGRLVNASLDAICEQEQIFSPWRLEHQAAPCRSASRGKERVVRGRPYPKTQTFRMMGKG